jgi:hypothetical protein
MADNRSARGATRLVLCGCALLAGTLAGLVAYRYGGLPTLGSPPHPPASHVIALGAVGLVCYTMFFLVCEAALLVLAVINIQDEKVHNKYKSLMLLVLYVFTFRYRRVLPAKFFAEAGGEAKDAPAVGGPRKAGKHRQKRRETTMSPDSPPPPSPPASPPVTDEEIRAFALLITRMATVLGDDETAAAAGRAAADGDIGPDRLFAAGS